jgi:DNA-binding response OmpR family regulator
MNNTLPRTAVALWRPVAAPPIEYGPLAVDAGGFGVTVAGCDVPVTVTEFQLLVALAKQPNRVLRRETLARVLPSGRSEPEPLPETRRAVDIHIAHLRRKLRDANCRCIETVRFVGYRFVPPVGSPADQ